MHTLDIANFKAFAKERIPLRKITLLYGANSAGKSSIIDSLLWLAHMSKTHFAPYDEYAFSRESFNFTLDECPVRLGSYENLVHLHDVSSEIQLRLYDDGFSTSYTFNSDGVNRVEYWADGELRPYLTIRTTGRLGGILDKMYVYGVAALDAESAWLSSFIKRGIEPRLALAHEGAVSEELRTSLGDGHLVGRFMAQLPRILERLLAKLQFDMCQFPPELATPPHADILFSEDALDFFFPESRSSTPEVFSAFRRLLGEVWDLFLERLHEQANLSSCRNLRYLGPVRPVIDLNKIHTMSHWDRMSHKPIGGWRLSRASIAATNQWLKAQDCNDTRYQLSRKVVTNKNKQIVSITHGLRDLNRDIEVDFDSVGSGFGQLLPILLASVSEDSDSNKGITCIKQPELHIHPKLQAGIMDFFVSQVNINKNRQFLIETHSEHLLLRLMRRIRQTTEGSLPDGIAPIKKDDVSIIFVENQGKQSTARELRLNAEGQLLNDWPGGFFEEGLREVLY